MNILLLFSQPWNVGGAETHVTDLVRELHKRGHKIYMALHGSNEAGKLHDVIEKQWLFDFRSANPLSYKTLGDQLVKLAQEHQIDIVHTHQRTSGYLAAYIKWRTGIPFVVTIHDPWKRAPLKKMHSKIFGDIITVSEFLRKRFIAEFGFTAERGHTIYNGADHNRYRPTNYNAETLSELRKSLGIEPNDKVVSLIARLYSSKGQQYLIEAAPKILARIPDCKFLLVGSGEHETKFREQIQRNGTHASFIFTGHRDDIPELIAISDVVVRPSDMEGLPINLIEAMLMEKPVVATGIAGVPEMINHGENGYMIEPGDTEKLASYLITLLAHSESAIKMGQNGRVIAMNKFTLQSLVSKVETIYSKLLNTKQVIL
jgi:glycosyltransferase involved in cell wall biosynthesis